MITTSIKLPDELKARARAAAEQRGISTHAFMVESIRQTVDAAERHAAFIAEAKKAREESLESGQGFAAEDVHDYIRDKSRGDQATRPTARSWRE